MTQLPEEVAVIFRACRIGTPAALRAPSVWANRTMLAGTLKGIIGQRLIRTTDGGRAAVCEVTVRIGRIQDFIMDPTQTGQIQQAIAEGEYYGMQTSDHVLLKRIEEDRIDYEEALKASGRPQDFKLMVQSTGLGMPRREGAALFECSE